MLKGRAGSFTTPLVLVSLLVVAVALHQVNKHQEDGYKEAECRGYAVPLFGHPHAEPFSAHRHETDLPYQEAQRQPADRRVLGAVEFRGGSLCRLERSEERRVGNEGVSTGSSWGAALIEKKKTI